MCTSSPTRERLTLFTIAAMYLVLPHKNSPLFVPIFRSTRFFPFALPPLPRISFLLCKIQVSRVATIFYSRRKAVILLTSKMVNVNYLKRTKEYSNTFSNSIIYSRDKQRNELYSYTCCNITILNSKNSSANSEQKNVYCKFLV